MKNFLLISILMISSIVYGGYISIENIISTEMIHPHCMSISTKVSNLGNEPARNIYQIYQLKDMEVISEQKELLPANASTEYRGKFNTEKLKPGRYHIIINTYYSDIAEHPFSAISAIPIMTGIPLKKPAFKIKTGISTIKHKGIVRVQLIKTRHQLPESGTVSLFLPANFADCEPVSVTGGNWPDVLEFEIENINALPNSTFTYEVMVNYIENNIHDSICNNGIIKLLPSTLSVMKIQIIYAALFCITGLLFYLSSMKTMRYRKYFYIFILLFIISFIIYHLSPLNIISDTTPTGGDIPAHNYMVRHLKENIFKGFPLKIISWAPGWWCGFPLFQFYFPLAYFLMAVLSFIIPLNIAFKIIMVIGLPMLPVACYASMRYSGLSKQTSILSAIVSLAFLFDSSNTMWGANIYSTLAGMISNSISFALFVFTLAFMMKDIAETKIRIRSIILLCLLISSHFFTSIMAALMVAVMPFIFSEDKWYKSLKTGVIEGLLALGLMSWWLLPVILKREYSVDFGLNWDVNIWEQMPLAFKLMIIPAVCSFFIPQKTKNQWRIIILLSWMFICGIFLFCFGFNITPVFVNIRLWPFITFPICMLSAISLGMILTRYTRYDILLICSIAALVILLIHNPGYARAMAKGNFTGLEGLPYYNVIEKLLKPLDGTPGRLANDLHPDNVVLGSSRVFETVPALINKPILEGGIVNSAIGSYYSYYIQSETSDNCAGFPPLVKPTTFNIENATEHMKLFNVKHFIARSPRTIHGLRAHPEWLEIDSENGWHLFELLTNDGSYIFTPIYEPIFVKTDNWKQNSLDWIYNINALNQPCVFVKDDMQNAITEKQFYSLLSNIETNQSYYNSLKKLPEANIETIENTGSKLTFKTDQIGLPHIIKISYFPNWKVKGADAVYMVSPDFMLIYPTQQTVTLYYGKTKTDILAYIISSIAFFSIFGLYLYKRFIYNK